MKRKMRRIKKRNTTRSNYVNAHKYMVDMYNQEAKVVPIVENIGLN